MANDDLLHQIDNFDLSQAKPRIPWNKRNYDGHIARNSREQRLAERDEVLLELIQVLKDQAISSVSPLFPFKEDATRIPQTGTPLDTDGVEISTFTTRSDLVLSTDFIKDLKLILSGDFSEPYISKMTLRQAVDPATNLIQVFIDLEFSARYIIDQQDHVILTLTDKAYNDVLDNSAPSSRDNMSFNLVPQEVGGKAHINSGIIEFSYLGSVHSLTETSWSIGEVDGIPVEGFTAVPELASIEYIFEREATKITQLAYNALGDLRNAVPFLGKVKHFPFDINATAGEFFSKYIIDLNISSLASRSRPFIKRIRKKDVGGDIHYVFVFAYNEYDELGNYVATVNIGLAEIVKDADRAEIKSLGSNRLAGADPDWLDETMTETTDNIGQGTMVISSYADMEVMFAELIDQSIPAGSSPSSPVVTSPVNPPQFVGVQADSDVIYLTQDTTTLDWLVLDSQGKLITVFERQLDQTVHQTRNAQIRIDGVLINRRTTYGDESTMRDFYGIDAIESLIDNDKIPLDDQWYDTKFNALNQYQLVDGKRRWRVI